MSYKFLSDQSTPLVSDVLDFAVIFNRIHKRGGLILDVGCREGIALQVMKSLDLNMVVGIEARDDYILKCKEKKLPSVQLNLDSCSFGNLSDVVMGIFMRHTLEHLEHPSTVLDELQKRMLPNAIIFIVVPLEEKDKRNKEKDGAFEKHYSRFTSKEELASFCNKHFTELATWIKPNIKNQITYVGCKGKKLNKKELF